MMRKERLLQVGVTAALALVSATTLGNIAVGTETSFDHSYQTYGNVLRTHVIGTRVDYASLKRNRGALDAVVNMLGRVTQDELAHWTRQHQIAYWINAYNAFTLQAIVDHYPIRNRWLSLFTFTPRNSIKQIDGVWTELRWRAAGADMTLDEIEHETLRVKYDEPRIHFAVNCAAVSCPPLRREPYVADRIERQLILATRDFLASDLGLQVDGSRLRVSIIFKWYGQDFISGYAHLVDANQSEQDRAILGVVAKYGPTQAAALVQEGRARIRFLRYDWSLNDTAPRSDGGAAAGSGHRPF